MVDGQLRAFMLCVVLCSTQLGFPHGRVLSCCHVCVNTWLMSVGISWVFVSCLFKHMACDFFLAM